MDDDDFADGFFCGAMLSDGRGPGSGWWLWLVVIAVVALAVYGFAHALG